MKKQSIRILAALLALALTTGLAGCGGADTGTSSAPPAGSSGAPSATESGTPVEPADDSYFPLEKPIELRMLQADWGQNTSSRVAKEMERLTNISIKWDLVANTDLGEKVNIYMASGDMPDMMNMWQDALEQYQNKGPWVNVLEWIDKMPNYQKWIEKYKNLLTQYQTAEGKLFCVSTFDLQGQLPMAHMWRKDILEKNGLALPTTTDEIYETLKKLKEVYPDVYPMSGMGFLSDLCFYTWHTGRSIFFNFDTDQFEFGPEGENLKKALEYARKLYTEGLVNPEYAVIDHEQLMQKMSTGGSFYDIYYHGSLLEWNENGRKTDPDFQVVGVLPPKNPDGLQGRAYAVDPTGRSRITISKSSKYIEECIRYLDFQMSDEIITLGNWGFEGETYTVDADGKKHFTDAVKSPQNPNGTIDAQEVGFDGRGGISLPYDVEAHDWEWNSSPERDEINELMFEHADEIALWYEPNIALPADMLEEKAKTMEAINTQIKEITTNYIYGKVEWAEVQAVFDKIISEGAYKKFIDYMNQEYKANPDRYTINKTLR